MSVPRPTGAPPDLDPQIANFIRGIDEALQPHDLTNLPLARVRELCEAAREPWTAGGPVMAHTSERVVPNGSHPVRIRHYDPAPGRPKPCLVYLHGGGWTLFSLDTHDRLMREYAGRAGISVIGVDYALSPEAKFPVALDQVVAVLRWLSRAGSELDVDPEGLAVGGDSSGANLAVAACLRLRDEGGGLPRAMLLNYGAFDATCDESSERRYGGDGYMLGSEEMRGFWENYLRDASDAGNPLACPLRAELEHLPPAFLTVAECDLLAAQNLAMAERLAAAGVPVRAPVYAKTSHSFLEAVSIAAVSDRALAEASNWLVQLLAPRLR